MGAERLALECPFKQRGLSPETFNRELFAQASMLYHNAHEFVKRELPETFALMEKLDAGRHNERADETMDTRTAGGVPERVRAEPGARRSSNRAGEPYNAVKLTSTRKS